MRKYKSYFVITALFFSLCINVFLGKIIGNNIDYNVWERILVIEICNIIFWGCCIAQIKSIRNSLQLFVPVSILTLFIDLALLSKNTSPIFNPYIIVIIVLINGAEMLLLKNVAMHIKKTKRNGIRVFFSNYWFEFVLSIIFVLLSLPVMNCWLTSGAYDYYENIRAITERWDFYNQPLGRLTLCGHSSQAYAILMAIGGYLTPDSVWGPRVIQLLMACVTIFCYSKILSTVFKRLPLYIRRMLLMLFTFSPLFFGVIGEINTDYATFCFFIWLLCASLNNAHILESFCALLLCFSKETGVILYAMYMLALLVHRYMNLPKDTFFKRTIRSVWNYQFLLNFMAGYFYILLFMTRSTAIWGSTETQTVARPVNVFGINFEYIFYKLKQMLSPNFVWLYLLLTMFCLLGFIIMKLKRKKRLRHFADISPERRLFALQSSFGLIGFMFMMLFYITWTNFRYLILWVLFYNLFLAFGLSLIVRYIKNMKPLTAVFLGFLLTLTFVSNYHTFDTVFAADEHRYDVGQDRMLPGQMFYTDSEKGIISDESVKGFSSVGMVYNREYTELGIVMEKFLKDINYTEKDVVLLPFNFSNYVTYANYLYRREDYGATALYWLVDKGILTVNYAQKDYSKTQNAQKFNTQIVNTWNDCANVFSQYERVYIVDFPYNEKKEIGYQERAIDIQSYKTLNYKLTAYRLK